MSANSAHQNYCNLIVLTTQIPSPIFSATHPEIGNCIFLSRDELSQTQITLTGTCMYSHREYFDSNGNPYLTLDLEICPAVELIVMTVNRSVPSLYSFTWSFCRFFLREFSKLIFQLNEPLKT